MKHKYIDDKTNIYVHEIGNMPCRKQLCINKFAETDSVD